MRHPLELSAGLAGTLGLLLAISCSAPSSFSEELRTTRQNLDLDGDWATGPNTSWFSNLNVSEQDILEYREEGWRVVDLDVVNSEPLRFSATFVRNEGAYARNWSFQTNLPASQINPIAESSGEGVALAKPYQNADDSLLYAVVFEERSDHANTLFVQQRTFDQLLEDAAELGMHVVDLEGMPNWSSPRYSAVLSDAGPTTGVLVHSTPEGVLTWLDDNPGHRLIHFTRHPVSGVAALVMSAELPARPTQTFLGVSAEELTHLYGRHYARPLDLTRRPDGDYDVVLLDNGLPMAGESPELFTARDAFDSRIREVMKDHGVPGVGIAVTNQGRLVYARGYGVAKIQDALGGEEAATPNTLFRIGSQSKNSASVAYLHLMESGAVTPAGDPLTLETRIFRDVLRPTLEPLGPYAASLDDIRAVDVMHHTAGFRGNPITDTASIAADYTNLTGESFRRTPTCSETVRWMLDKEPSEPNNDGYSYYNTGPCIIAAVIEAITGETFEDYLATEIFEATGTQNHIMNSPDRLSERLSYEAQHYSSAWDIITDREMTFPRNLDPDFVPSDAWAATGLPDYARTDLLVPFPYGGIPLQNGTAPGGLMASPVAYAKYLSSLDGSGETRVISECSFERLQNGLDELPGSPHRSSYGLFVGVGDTGVTHNGAVGGGGGVFTIRTDDDTAWVAFLNTTPDSACPVTVYAEEDFQGAQQCLGAGRWIRADQDTRTAPRPLNVTVGSIRIAPGYRITLHDATFDASSVPTIVQSLERSQPDLTLQDNAFFQIADIVDVHWNLLGELEVAMQDAYSAARAEILAADWDLFPAYGFPGGDSCTGDLCGGPDSCGPSSPCEGICENPSVLAGPNVAGWNLGTSAVCHETDDSFSHGNCSSMQGRTMSVDGQPVDCSRFEVGPSVAGGHCIHVTAGGVPWAGYSTWQE